MPWGLNTLIEQREEFVRLARLPDANITELSRRFDISRKTAYKWLAKDDQQDRSGRPKISPNRTPDKVEATVLQVRDAHPAWGARKIAPILERDLDT